MHGESVDVAILMLLLRVPDHDMIALQLAAGISLSAHRYMTK